jgi:hypothetical protein
VSIELQFVGGESLEIDVDLDEWIKGFKKALRSGEVLEVRRPDGARLGINPRAVLFWTSGDTDTAAPSLGLVNDDDRGR